MNELTTRDIIKDRLTHDQYIGWLLGSTIEAQCALNEVEDKSGVAERLLQFASELNKELNNADPDYSPCASGFLSSNEVEKREAEVALQLKPKQPKSQNKTEKKSRPPGSMLIIHPVEDGMLSPKRQALHDTAVDLSHAGGPISRKELQEKHCEKTGQQFGTVCVAVSEMLKLKYFQALEDDDYRIQRLMGDSDD